MSKKKFLKQLDCHDLNESQNILNIIFGDSLPEPLELYRFHFKYLRRSLKKIEPEKVNSFKPFLDAYSLKCEHIVAFLIPFWGALYLLISIIYAYNLRYIMCYTFATEEVEIGSKKRKYFRKESRKVLYDCLCKPIPEERNYIKKKQITKIIFLFVAILFQLLMFMTFGALLGGLL